MRRERQDHAFRQTQPDRVTFRAPEFDGRADEVGPALGINCEAMGAPAREKQQGWLNELEIGPSALGDPVPAGLERAQATHISELRRLAQVPGTERLSLSGSVRKHRVT